MDLAPEERRFGSALAGYSAAVILVVTLAPFRFAWPARLGVTGFVTAADLAANVAFFVPLGFFLAFAGSRRPLVHGFMLSLGVELGQVFVPGRFPSPLDLAANALGAGLGAVGYRALRAGLARRSRPAALVALDLPLAGLAYLMLPLLWVIGISAGQDGARRGLAFLVGLAGAVIVAAIDRHLLTPRGLPRWVGPAAVAGWLGLGLLPGWYGQPLILGAAMLAAGATEALLAGHLASAEPTGRRYEGSAVARAAIPILVFVGAAVLWPVDALYPAWKVELWSGWARGADRLAILGFLELAAAATVVGYAAAEVRGRVAEPPARSRRMIWSIGIGLGLVVFGLGGFHRPHRVGLLEVLLLASAARFGGTIYWRQRALARTLLGRPNESRDPEPADRTDGRPTVALADIVRAR